uniref:V-SNARE coiled-coil homology domain-containing protein n=1 Tax=Takifugu rubripes TaxID=31033 RepID=A0A674N1T9_TAKRU
AQNIKNTTGGLERDQKLSELDDRADALQAGLKNKYWWKNCKVALLFLFSNLAMLFFPFILIFSFI